MDLQAIDTADTQSALRIMNRANKRLEHLLFNLEHESGAQHKILDVVRAVGFAVDLNPDVALACILLNQAEGSYAVRHCIDSAVVALLVARALEAGPSELASIGAAALTMNLGMLRNQEQLQGKSGAITPEELALIRSHPQQSVNLLEQAGVRDPDWLSYVLLHHENEDGSGYPAGKTGADIPLYAKIVSLADRYCARVSSRNYRKSQLPDAALTDILIADSASIDPMLTACFIRVLGTCPTGTVVRLENNEVGVITGQGSGHMTPIVHALVAGDGCALDAPVARDSGAKGFGIRAMLAEGQSGLHFTMQQLWGAAAEA